MLFKVALGFALLAAAPAFAGDLRITVDGVRSGNGSLMIGLYDTAAGFEAAIKRSTEAGLLNDPLRVAGVALRADAGSQTIVITGLKPGRYAVIAFHDENDDGKLEATPWGVPLEGYGFSNDAQGFLHAPSFGAAAVAVTDPGTTATISLIYPPPPSQPDLPYIPE
jgi:uncharacterized protein (DUF2141 family)